LNRAVPLMLLPLAFILGLYAVVRENPSYITDNFTFVWFLMVLVVITSALGLMYVAITGKDGDEAEEHDHGEAAKEAAH
jgi:hypothetical protein